MKNVIAALAVLYFATTSALAALPSTPPLKTISPLVLGYLNSIGCADDTVLDPKLVTRIVDKQNQIDGYLAFATTDASCTLERTTFWTLVLLQPHPDSRDPGDYRYLKVDPIRSEPAAVLTGRVRTITSFYQRGGQLFATGLEHGPDDANCCPSKKILLKVMLVTKLVSAGKVGTELPRSVYTWEFVKAN